MARHSPRRPQLDQRGAMPTDLRPNWTRNDYEGMQPMVERSLDRSDSSRSSCGGERGRPKAWSGARCGQSSEHGPPRPKSLPDGVSSCGLGGSLAPPAWRAEENLAPALPGLGPEGSEILWNSRSTIPEIGMVAQPCALAWNWRRQANLVVALRSSSARELVFFALTAWRVSEVAPENTSGSPIPPRRSVPALWPLSCASPCRRPRASARVVSAPALRSAMCSRQWPQFVPLGCAVLRARRLAGRRRRPWAFASRRPTHTLGPLAAPTRLVPLRGRPPFHGRSPVGVGLAWASEPPRSPEFVVTRGCRRL